MEKSEKITLKELMGKVGCTKGRKLPNAKALMESESSVMIWAEESGAVIRVYENGFVLYEKGGHRTVFGLDRYEHILMACDFANEDLIRGWRDAGCDVVSRRYGDHVEQFVAIPLSMFMDAVWTVAVVQIGDNRLEHNEEERARSKVDFSMDSSTDDWNEKLRVPDFVEDQMKAEEEREKEEKLAENLRLLAVAKEDLTEKQLQVLEKYYSTPFMTEKKVADLLEISQQGVHKHLVLGMKKLRSFFQNEVVKSAQLSGCM